MYMQASMCMSVFVCVCIHAHTQLLVDQLFYIEESQEIINIYPQEFSCLSNKWITLLYSQSETKG